MLQAKMQFSQKPPLHDECARSAGPKKRQSRAVYTLLPTPVCDEKGKSRSILEGIELIVAKLDKTLEEQGIVPFDSVGQDFDPELHEALMSEKTDKGDNVILKEFEKGYRYVDKILRHAKVVVSKN